MSTKRKLKGGSIPQAKHRYSLTSKSKLNPFELENLCLRFPQTLAKLQPKDFLNSGMIKLMNQEPTG